VPQRDVARKLRRER